MLMKIIVYLLIGIAMAEGSILAQRKAGRPYGALAYFITTVAWPLVVLCAIIRGR